MARAEGRKPVKRGQPLEFGPVWRKIVDRKLRKLSARKRVVLVDALRQCLYPFSLFRDFADLELRLLKGELTKADILNALDIYVHWLDQLEEAFSLLFRQTTHEQSAEVIFRKPIAMLRHMLSDLREGDTNIWTSINAKARGDRRDARDIRDLKDVAAKAYKLMRSINAGAEEAVDVLNKVALSYTRSHNLTPLAAFTQDTIRRRSTAVGPFDSEMAEQILTQCLPDAAVRDVRSMDQNMRWVVLTSIAIYSLSGILDNVWTKSGAKIRI